MRDVEYRAINVLSGNKEGYHLFAIVCTLCKVMEDDLHLDGKFALFGAKRERFLRPFSLDNALERYGGIS